MSVATAQSRHCAGCGLDYAPSLLACPGCGRLSHSDELKGLLVASQEAEAAQDWAGALLPLRDAAALLPADSLQLRQVQAHIVRLSSLVESQPVRTRPKATAGPKVGTAKQVATGVIGVGAFLFKFKALLAGLLGKGKFLLLAFQDGLPLLSLLGSFGVYWTAWGWKLAAAFLAALYIHELGHVAALKRYGFPATAPMFIPGLGAFVRLLHPPATSIEDARVGLAGPWWGLSISALLAVIWLATGMEFFGVVARLSALINLFNLLPIPPLDGGRALNSLDEEERLVIAALAGGLAFALNSLLLGSIALLALLRAQGDSASLYGDSKGALRYAGVLTLLAALVFTLPGS